MNLQLLSLRVQQCCVAGETTQRQTIQKWQIADSISNYEFVMVAFFSKGVIKSVKRKELQSG